MRETPILFTAPMVRALLAGTKNQTRRIVNLTDSGRLRLAGSSRNWHIDDANAALACPYGQPGDRLWVRETSAMDCGDGSLLYRADGDDITRSHDGKWIPSIFMRRASSRISLEITGIRVERLNDISENDACWEGIDIAANNCDYRATYRQLWESINGPGSWALNPWVWVVEFKKLEGGSK